MSRRPPRGDYIETVSTCWSQLIIVPPPTQQSANVDCDQDSGNKVARKAVLVGTQNIMLGGKTVIQPDVMIRGDLVRTATSSSSSSGAAAASPNTTAVAIGRYSFLAKGALLRPGGRIYKGAFTYMPLRLGDHVFVGQGSVVQAASVGSHVSIGKGCTIGECAIIKDYVKILDDTVVAPFTVIPSFSVVAGQPGRVVGEIPEGGYEDLEFRELYKTVGNNPQPPAA